MPDILHRVGIKSSPERVYHALSDETGLAGGWTTNTKASAAVGAIDPTGCASRSGWQSATDYLTAGLQPEDDVRAAPLLTRFADPFRVEGRPEAWASADIALLVAPL